MKLIKSSFSILDDINYNIESIYKRIELVGRCCTKSEDRITEDSSKEFVDRMIKLGHGAVLEHGSIYLSLDMTSREQYFKYCYNKFSKANSIGSAEYSTWKGFVTTNLRVLVENGWMDDLQYLCEPTEFHEKRVCVKFILPIGISREFCRHRVFSFMEMSTRYCNFSKDKFDNELTFIQPSWVKYKGEITPDTELCFLSGQYNREDPTLRYLASLVDSKYSYLTLLSKECKPQEARDVLPLSTKTELYMTGFISDWKSFFELRSNKYGRGGAHPQADELATPLYEEFKRKGYI